METLTPTAIQERLQEMTTAEERGTFIKELCGPTFDLIINDELTERIGQQLSTSEKIKSLREAGLTMGGISRYMKSAEGKTVTREKIRAAMEEDLPLMREWRARPLEKIYPIIFFDAMHNIAVKENGKTVKKTAYHALGINMDGVKELLGIWISDNEGARFWNSVLFNLKNRGVQDILIACVDGLTSFSEAIRTEFPRTDVQRCIVHLQRQSSKFVRGEKKEKFCDDLKFIYNAPTEDAGLLALEKAKEAWPDFLPHMENWDRAWPDIVPFFSYSTAVRKLIYTNNAIESLHSILRRALNARGVLTNEEDIFLTIWNAQLSVMNKWANKPVQDWGVVLGQFSLMYPDRGLLE